MSSCGTEQQGSNNRRRNHGVDGNTPGNIIDNETDNCSDSSDEGENNVESGPPEKKIRVSSSAVHEEFVEVKDKSGKWTSKCKHCVIKDTIYGHKNSSSLLFHLEKKHPVVYKRCIEKNNKERDARKENSSRIIVGKSSSGHKTASSSLFTNNNPQHSSSSGPMSKFVCSSKISIPDWKREKINKKYAYWLGASGLPVSAITEDSNFKEFIAEINSDVKLPGRKKVMSDCSNLSKIVQERIKGALENAKKVSVTVDIWSSVKCKNSYIGITVHLFNHKTKKREAYRIACQKFDVAHTGENIAIQINSIMTEYGVNSKVFYCLSDNGSNMKKGIRLLAEENDILETELDEDFWDAWDDRFESELADEEDGLNPGDSDTDDDHDEEEDDETEVEVVGLENDQRAHRTAFRSYGLKRLGCFPHTLQLAILKSTKKKRNQFGKVLKKSRKLVVMYRRSSKAKAVLQKTEFKKRLLGYCKTRWWTELLMAGRLCEALECEQVPGPLELLVDTMDWPATVALQDRDYQYLKAYTIVMGPIMEKSDQLGAETVSTIHLVYPTLMELNAHLDEVSGKPLCKAFATDLKKNIDFYFKHLTDPENISFDPIVLTATYLSPVHHHILREDQISIAEDHIKTLLVDYGEAVEIVPANPDDGGRVAEEIKSVTIPGLKFLSKKIFDGTKTVLGDSRAALNEDLRQYKLKSKQVVTKLMKSANQGEGEQGDLRTKRPIDPMDFWVKQIGQFTSKLPLLALDIMAVPASSVPSERLFSISGLLSSG